MELAIKVKKIGESIPPKPNLFINLSRPALVKHLALSGCNFIPNIQKLFRCIGMFFHYNYYLRKESFDNDSFSKPPKSIYDPTEISQFSNIAGKAIADFLSKRIDGSMFTVNYEAAMIADGLSIKGKRPDLLAFPKNSMFAIEAKGLSAGGITPEDMKDHVKQSQSGGISVDFCVASVSHNLYRKVKCNYYKNDSLHDDYGKDERQYILDELRKLEKNYYSEFSELEKKYHQNIENTEADFYIGKEGFYKIDLSHESFKKDFQEYFSDFPLKIWLKEILNFYKPKLIIPKDIETYAKEGLTDDLEPFKFDSNGNISNSDYNIGNTNDENFNKENIYIDNDRIGIELICDRKESFFEYLLNCSPKCRCLYWREICHFF